MLIVALVLAVVGLAALVTAIVTSNEVVAWVCIAASVIGVILLIVDALRERQRSRAAAAVTEDAPAALDDADPVDETYQNYDDESPGDADADPVGGAAAGDTVGGEVAEPTESIVVEAVVEESASVELRYAADADGDGVGDAGDEIGDAGDGDPTAKN